MTYLNDSLNALTDELKRHRRRHDSYDNSDDSYYDHSQESDHYDDDHEHDGDHEHDNYCEDVNHDGICDDHDDHDDDCGDSD